eukprot:superscaffoldBa00000128_g1864
MNAQPEAATNTYNLPTMADSDDSEDETGQEEPPITSWNELSIIERVGLNSVEMSEKDLETAFSQIALAFRCDQYTLKQRLQAEEHARNLAEENIQLELTRGRETLETLKGLCLDSKRSTILQRLELSLDILGGTVERISNTAEVLGAVHQEARVSRAVELMVAHVENLRRRHDRNMAELEELKKMNPFKNAIDSRASPEPEDGESRMRSSQPCIRRREKTKRDLTKLAAGSSKTSSPACPSPTPSPESSVCAITKDESHTAEERPLNPVEAPPEAPAAQLPPDPPPVPEPECPPPKQVATRKIQNKKYGSDSHNRNTARHTILNSPLDTLRQRHKGKAVLSKKKADKDKKSTNIYRRISPGTCGSLWRQRPLVHWLYRCRWALLCTYLFVLLSVITLTYFLWKLQDGTFEE